MTDWTIFYLISPLLHYELALILSYTVGGIVNFTLNKIYTFRSRSRRIIKQYSIFYVISIIALFLSMGIMFILVDLAELPEMISRIITSGIIFIFNYLMHKSITFKNSQNY